MSDFRFPQSFLRTSDGKMRSVRRITCACGATEEIEDGGRTALPDDLVRKKILARGWVVGSSPRKDRCPACARTQKRKDEKVEPKTVEPLKAAPPREMTRADARRIRDALDEHYMDEHGCYRDSFTDEALAQKLKVPRAWVAQLRDTLYGPETNQAAARAAAEIAEVRRQLAELSALVEKRAAEAMDLMTRIDQFKARLDAL